MFLIQNGGLLQAIGIEPGQNQDVSALGLNDYKALNDDVNKKRLIRACIIKYANSQAVDR